MSWPKAITTWLLIVIAESLHGPLGVLVGSAIVFAIAWASVRWIAAKSFAEQFRVGLLWVVLIVIFEFTLGSALGYSLERLLSDCNMAQGGFLGLGLLFTLFAPALAARVRGFGPHPTTSRTKEDLF